MNEHRILFDQTYCENALYPLSLTRDVADLRTGIFTLREKWHRLFTTQMIDHTIEPITLPANLIPSLLSFSEIKKQITSGDIEVDTSRIEKINHPSDLAHIASKQIIEDTQLLFDRENTAFDSRSFHNTDIHIHKTAIIESCFLNTDDGPIVIDEHAHVMQGSMLRGPIYIGKHSVVKMGAQLYSGVSVGPFCTVGGEIKNSVLLSHTSKAHEGYLGDSVLGSWCNLGAGTTSSNLKNTAGDISYALQDGSKYATGRKKAGLVMGDFSRSAIQTAFNTATTVGVCCNVYHQGITPQFIPSFSWGNKQYLFEKAIQHLQNWKNLKNEILSPIEILTLEKIYNDL